MAFTGLSNETIESIRSEYVQNMTTIFSKYSRLHNVKVTLHPTDRPMIADIDVTFDDAKYMDNPSEWLCFEVDVETGKVTRQDFGGAEHWQYISDGSFAIRVAEWYGPLPCSECGSHNLVKVGEVADDDFDTPVFYKCGDCKHMDM